MREEMGGVMRRIIDKRLITWGVAAILVAAAFLLATVRSGQAAENGTSANDAVIDTAADIEQSQCMPCHIRLAEVNEPGLIFGHGKHLIYSCDACHSRMPHRQGKTEKVPMETCFACHGVQHGPGGELATGKCRDCHTKSFKLRPRAHTDSWAKRPHAAAADRSGVNGCMMCHNAPKDCDKCHKDESVDIGKMPVTYHPMIEQRPKGPSVKIYPQGKVAMSQCSFCHPDLDAITPGRLIFAHAAHLQRNYRCEACHETFAHQAGGLQKPDMLSCYRCHSVYHNGKGLVAEGEDCLKCHPKSFKLMPNDHTMKFIKGSHGAPAAKDPAYCAMCHQSEFCVGCHRGKKTSPNAPGRPVIPEAHKKAAWRGKHGPEFLAGEGACGVCHDDPSCKRCHATVMPHPVGWIQDHRPERGVSAEDCNVCHADRSKCQNCHHQSVKSAELTAKNCTPCHDAMKQKPATEIKHKGFSEHAVHFDVATAKGKPWAKGKPYRCYECHVDFGASEAAQKIEATQGHDLRLCEQCHGALDPFNELIAPYKGAELCLRCHRDLNI